MKPAKAKSTKNLGQTWWACQTKDYMDFLEKRPGDRLHKSFTTADESKLLWDIQRDKYFGAVEQVSCPEVNLFTGTHEQMLTRLAPYCGWKGVRFWKKMVFEA